ncbi:hypothetical protein A6O24_14385 [Acidithiobacillus thiooxidans]|uniref:hypothetical protein n=2 Tax=Acidithiobacillus thiooxidans TaxID=930 RepID=UPI0004650DB2|nr:hypothetical protein [Acidithiobacillus thiooxidans]OCX72203.1 hypothetical protein A6O24_14385 [Acidithiobacillus thiooxidans]OCX83667.1 hypothetical protein A6O26_06525 [Acidithiobacillus thiooxidans]OFC50259.1 hypothetical protein BAE47_02890 [Acidithiobacillus thiooxidans]
MAADLQLEPALLQSQLAEVASVEDLRKLLEQLRSTGFILHGLFPAKSPKDLAAAIWRGTTQALLRLTLADWRQLFPFILLSEFLGSLRQLGEISDQELKDTRTRLVHQHLAEFGEAGWLAGLVLTSLYDADMRDYVRHNLIWQDPQWRGFTLTWMSLAFTAQGTWTPEQQNNRMFLFESLTRYAEETAFFVPPSAFMDAYWTADPSKYAGLRKAFVRWAGKQGMIASRVPLQRHPSGEKPKIGIVAGNWRANHASRKALLSSVRAMREWASLWLVDTRPHEDTVYADFDGVIPVSLGTRPDGSTVVQDEALAAANLDFLYFIETYQAELDTLLALRRYAPIQATGYGIPVTTASPNMDIFFTGKQVEGRGQADYVERVIALPGIGMHSERRAPLTTKLEKPLGGLRVVVTANLIKYTLEYLESLGRIAQAVPDAEWIFLPNSLHPQVLAAAPRVADHFPGRKIAWYAQTTELYGPILNSADLILDAVPYSGYTTVVDAVSAGIPILTWSGRHGHERLGAAVARLGGMPTAGIATSLPDFERKAVDLLRSPLKREMIRRRIHAHSDRFFARENELALAEAIHKLVLPKK